MPRFNELFQHCQANCKPNVQYLKTQTGGNNPNISSKMRYSEILRTRTPQTFPTNSTFVLTTCPNEGGKKYKCNNPIFVNNTTFL
jgi:hypothetical protein